jgi:hypothetical protein
MDLRGGRPVTVPRLWFGIKLGHMRKAAVFVGLLAIALACAVA